MIIQYGNQEFECETLRKMFINKNIFVVVNDINISELEKDGILKILENGTVIEELNVNLVNQELDYVSKKTFLTFQYN